MKTNEPRSLRLNQEHRDDTVAAVLQEWERQNPRPEFPEGKQTYLDVVKKYLPKARSVGTVPEALLNLSVQEIAEYLNTSQTITVLPINSEGEVRNGMANHINVLYSLAKDAGLPVAAYFVMTERHTAAELIDSVAADTDCEWAKEFNEKFGMTPQEALDSGDMEFEFLPADDNGNKFAHAKIKLASFIVKRNAGHNANAIIIHPSSDEEYYATRREHKKEVEAWRKEQNALRSETADMLRQFNTTKQLRDAWPDIVPYLPPHLQDPEAVVRVPVPVVTRLNERLGIGGDQ